MTLKNQVQPVVTVAAFDPTDDKVVVLKRAPNARVNPGLYEGIGGKIEFDDKTSVERLILEVAQETGGKIDYNATHFETFGIARTCRSHLLVSRYVAPLISGSNLTIPPEEAHEHPEFRFVTSHDFHTLQYVPEVREFLARLFAEQRRTGTLLSTLKQPVYIRPTFLDFEGEQAIIPMDDHRAGMPRTYLREDQKHLHETLGDIIHEHVSKKQTRAEAIRMNVLPKNLVHREATIPAWIIDYGITVTFVQARQLREQQKVEVIRIRDNLKFTLELPPSYSPKVKRVLEEIKTTIAETIKAIRSPEQITFPPAQKHSRDFR